MLYVGGLTLSEQHPAGLYVSPDGGRTWLRENAPSGSNYSCHSLAVHPAGFLLAGLDLGGAQTGIRRGGAGGTWKQLHGGLPDGDNAGRISLAMAPSRPDTVYALVGNRLGSESSLVLSGHKLHSRTDRENRWRCDGSSSRHSQAHSVSSKAPLAATDSLSARYWRMRSLLSHTMTQHRYGSWRR